MTIKSLACTAALVAVMPLPTAAATLDYFLKIDSAPGESADSKHKNWIDVLSWSWGVSAIGGGGSGAGVGKSVFEPFSWEQHLDASYVPMFLGLVQGTHLGNAQLDVVKLGAKDPIPFFQMILGNSLVTKLTSSGAGDAITVASALTYDKVTLRYRKQKADGSYDAPIEGTFDLKANGVGFSGDPGVLRGMVEAGGTLNFVNQVPEPASWASLAAGLALVAGVLRRRRSADGAPSG